MAKRYHNFKSRTNGELIPSVVIEFNSWPNLYITKDQWEKDVGPYRRFIKEFQVPVGELKKIHKILLNPDDFPSEEWCP